MKLNLEWVTNVIGDSYKEWKNGDEIIIKAQTGTGKTYFIKNVLIPYMDADEQMLIVCNRRHLKQQIKRDLLRKTFEESKIKVCETFKVDSIDDLTYGQLEKITRIDNVTIISYQSLAYKMVKREEGNNDFDFSQFKYVVFDECHFILADSEFNNITRYALAKILEHEFYTTKIYISATIEEVKSMIVNRRRLGKNKYIEYSTGVDYSYIEVTATKYLHRVNDMYNLIINDKSDDKWLVFVTNLKIGMELAEKLGEDMAKFIKAGDKGQEINNIINYSKFDCKVLISTKCLDNGININDLQLKNIIILEYDEVTFIQELGRIRVDINNAPKINLYIPMRSRLSFEAIYKQKIQPKLAQVNLFKDCEKEFQIAYRNNHKAVKSDLFYLDIDTNKWCINKCGLTQLNRVATFTERIIDELKENKYAYVKEVARWLNLDIINIEIIEESIEADESDKINEYLQSIVGEKLNKDKRGELINIIGLTDAYGRQQKSFSIMKSYIDDNTDYILNKKRIDTKNFRGTVWIINQK